MDMKYVHGILLQSCEIFNKYKYPLLVARCFKSLADIRFMEKKYFEAK
jgi:hypothetical protein